MTRSPLTERPHGPSMIPSNIGYIAVIAVAGGMLGSQVLIYASLPVAVFARLLRTRWVWAAYRSMRGLDN